MRAHFHLITPDNKIIFAVKTLFFYEGLRLIAFIYEQYFLLWVEGTHLSMFRVNVNPNLVREFGNHGSPEFNFSET